MAQYDVRGRRALLSNMQWRLGAALERPRRRAPRARVAHRLARRRDRDHGALSAGRARTLDVALSASAVSNASVSPASSCMLAHGDTVMPRLMFTIHRVAPLEDERELLSASRSTLDF